MASLALRSAKLSAARPQGRNVQVAASSRTIWLPDAKIPAHLNGSMPGDNGFDPLGLGQNPDRCARRGTSWTCISAGSGPCGPEADGHSIAVQRCSRHQGQQQHRHRRRSRGRGARIMRMTDERPMWEETRTRAARQRGARSAISSIRSMQPTHSHRSWWPRARASSNPGSPACNGCAGSSGTLRPRRPTAAGP
jgi:hypothetical protein